MSMKSEQEIREDMQRCQETIANNVNASKELRQEARERFKTLKWVLEEVSQ